METIAGQSIMDVTIEQSGSLDALFDFASTNDVEITALLVPGIAYVIPSVEINKKVRTVYANKGVSPATFYDLPTEEPPVPGEGIGFWMIGNDFIIS
jgi:hypothetical protein